MNLHDPARPVPPTYGIPPLGVFPRLQVWPLSPDTVQLGMMLANAANSFSWRTVEIPTEHLAAAARQYYENPERFLLGVFNYIPPVRTAIANSKGITLEDLDLD